MKRTNGPGPCTRSLDHLTGTIADLFEEGKEEICLVNWRKRANVEKDSSAYSQELIIPKVGFPHRINPFDCTLVSFDRDALKLTILITLLKPLRIVAEIYSPDGRYIKRLFNTRLARGMSEIVGIGCCQSRGSFVLLLSSSEGVRSFKFKVDS